MMQVETERVPKGNILRLWGNLNTMNLNTMIHTNILQSPYFKNNLSELTTYHEVIDEIYYKVSHLEPWERGSRKTDGQSGMCGGVRGVGAGGIVSTAYCLLFKLFALKLTRKQLKSMLEHPDSPYIRALGFMYIRYCLPPEDLWTWYYPYINDPELIDVKAGGGMNMTIGSMIEQWITRIDWFATLFPRIPVPVEKKIKEKLWAYKQQMLQETKKIQLPQNDTEKDIRVRDSALEAATSPLRNDDGVRSRSRERDRNRGRLDDRTRERSRERSRMKDRDTTFRDGESRDSEKPFKDARNSRESRDARDSDKDKEHEYRHKHKHHKHYRHHKHHGSKSRSGSRSRFMQPSPKHRESSFERDLKRARERQQRGQH